MQTSHSVAAPPCPCAALALPPSPPISPHQAPLCSAAAGAACLRWPPHCCAPLGGPCQPSHPEALPRPASAPGQLAAGAAVAQQRRLQAPRRKSWMRSRLQRRCCTCCTVTTTAAAARRDAGSGGGGRRGAAARRARRRGRLRRSGATPAAVGAAVTTRVTPLTMQVGAGEPQGSLGSEGERPLHMAHVCWVGEEFLLRLLNFPWLEHRLSPCIHSL